MSESQVQPQPTPESADTQVEVQPGAATEPTFTQADLKKIAAKEKREGKSSAVTDLLEKTGAESLDDVLSVYESYKMTQAEMESDAEKARKVAERAQEKQKAAEERYTNTLREYALRDALRDANINPERIKGAMRLADMSALEVDAEGNISGIEDVVAAVQEESPEWFQGEGRARVDAPQTSGTGVARPDTAQNADPEWQHASFLANLLNGKS